MCLIESRHGSVRHPVDDPPPRVSHWGVDPPFHNHHHHHRQSQEIARMPRTSGSYEEYRYRQSSGSLGREEYRRSSQPRIEYRPERRDVARDGERERVVVEGRRRSVSMQSMAWKLLVIMKIC
ncbi:hypothetical protein M501DRAFT_991528 [Patellaria atrata CBS 101060]|uniref:Uncharacterized protein n=1 Tax=Patellaria atrata CBS 101060 TaxID=1346257 RepID=A0A9P4SD92_9PEZI|nr:hypothetical protein M501DRAFT_991528 [Patellaria atrata CBS 101060]